MYLGRRAVAQTLMQALMVVEREVVVQTGFEFRNPGVVHEIDVLVLDSAPKALDEDVVQSSAPAVHADQSASGLDCVGECSGCELSALIGVEDIRCALLQRLTQSDQAKLAIQSVGQLPTQNVAAVPVDDRHQVHEAALHGNIGDICAPDLVGSSDLESTQEIRKDLVPWDWFAGVGLWIDGLQAHHLHQTSHSLVVDLMSLALQPGRDPWPAVERRFGVLPIDQPHELQVVVGLSCRLEVQC